MILKIKDEKQNFEFSLIRKTDLNGREYWTSRDLFRILGYSEYRHFLPVIEKSIRHCESAGLDVNIHFEHFLDMVSIGSGAKRNLKNIKLSRYACYLILQNCNPQKQIVKQGMEYLSSNNMSMQESLLNSSVIGSKIFTVRNVQVILDKDLADLYSVKPFRLREQVSRNLNRFPSDFMFQLTEHETEFMVSQNAIPSKKSLGGHLPYVFTEHGVANLSSVLKSEKAVEVNIQIMRKFVEMRRFIQASSLLFERVSEIEKKQIVYKHETDRNFEKVFEALEDKTVKPKQGVFFDGQIFDAHRFVSDLVRSAIKSITLIDNYVDDTVLTLFSKRSDGVALKILTKTVSKQLALDVKKFNEQFPVAEIQEFSYSHDRFLIIDGTNVYHIGASLKDLGKKWFAFSKLDIEIANVLKKVGVT